jgi:adenylylsulfate kinase
MDCLFSLDLIKRSLRAMKATNIVWHDSKVTKEDRQKLNGHKSVVLWFTGLSGAGKSTLSVEVEKELHQRGIRTYILDGDNIRHGLNKDLGFSAEDRKENIRRIGEVAKLMVDAGIVTLTAFISPYREDREMVRQLLGEKEFIEIYVKCSLEECERRDPKGLYKKARAGEIKGFTGIDDPYEEPENPELVVETDKQTLEESIKQIIAYLEENRYLK